MNHQAARALRAARHQARAMATATVRAPMQLHTLEGRYATAAFNAAARTGSLEAMAGDLSRLRDALAAAPGVQSALESPATDRAVKGVLVDRIATRLSLAPTTATLLHVMLQTGRVGLAPAVASAFAMLMRAHRREVAVCITSAAPLEKGVEDRVLQALRGARLLDTSQTVQVMNKVNPAILGGLVVEVGDNTIDLSAATKLAKITKALQESV